MFFSGGTHRFASEHRRNYKTNSVYMLDVPGGFLAHSAYTGLLSGLMQAASKKRNVKATMAATDLFARFDVSGHGVYIMHSNASHAYCTL